MSILSKLAERKAREMEARGETPIMEICSDCGQIYGAKPGGEVYPPELRKSHGYCPPCARRFEERFLDCKETKDIR